MTNEGEGREWGCEAQCSAPCAYKGREQEGKQSKNMRVAKGKQGQDESRGCPASCSVPCAGEGTHRERGREQEPKRGEPRIVSCIVLAAPL